MAAHFRLLTFNYFELCDEDKWEVQYKLFTFYAERYKRNLAIIGIEIELDIARFKKNEHYEVCSALKDTLDNSKLFFNTTV